MDGIVAVVGRPNVGKSSFFNRVLGERVSIVEDVAGVTRDRIYGKTTWLTKNLSFIDTGGLETSDHDFKKEIAVQVEIAISEADVIIFICDGITGIVNDDIKVARLLQKTKKPIIVAVNKIDDISKRDVIYDFYKLGFENIIPISCSHGIGIGDVLDLTVKNIPLKKHKNYAEDAIKFAIIGQPNVGKSSLINSILNEDRVIVSNIEGTTRDAIDTPFTYNGQNYVAIDTAGIRKRGKIFENIEKYSVIRSMSAIDRCDVVLFVIDGEKGIRQHDKHVAGFAHNEGKPVIIIYNKWDAVEKDDKTMNKITEQIRKEFVYLSYAPILFVSALTKQRINSIMPMIDQVFSNSTNRISTAVVNEVILNAQIQTPPPSHNGQRLKIYYGSQVSVGPPTFVLFVNDPELCHFSYKRYLENKMRFAFDFMGTPINIILRKRNLKIDN